MILDIKTGEVWNNKIKIRLTKNEMAALSALNRKGVVPLTRIYEAVYKVKPAKLSKYDIRQIYVLIARLRRKLRKCAVIYSRYGYGYEIEVKENGEI